MGLCSVHMHPEFVPDEGIQFAPCATAFSACRVLYVTASQDSRLILFSVVKIIELLVEYRSGRKCGRVCKDLSSVVAPLSLQY